MSLFFFFLRKIFLKAPTGTYLFCSLSKISTHFEELEVQSVLYHKYQLHISCAVIINFCLAIWFRIFDYPESKEEKERRKRNKSQSDQPKCSSDVTHITYLLWPRFYFPWRFAVFLFFWQIFFHLSSLFFCCHEISYRLDFSFRCEATFVSPRIIFFIFVSVSYIRSGRWIHQIHSGGQTSYKIRQNMRRPKKASRCHICFEFFAF